MTDAAGTGTGQGPSPQMQYVVRGGVSTPDRFAAGRDVAADAMGLLWNISVNTWPNTTVAELAAGVPHGQIGVSTIAAIVAAGGAITADPRPENPYHALLGGITAETASRLFSPTIPNPARIRSRTDTIE